MNVLTASFNKILLETKKYIFLDELKFNVTLLKNLIQGLWSNDSLMRVCVWVCLSIFRLCVNLPLNTEIALLYSMQTQDPNAIELPKRQEQVSKWAEINAPTIESDQAEILEVIKILQKEYDNKFGNWAYFFFQNTR